MNKKFSETSLEAFASVSDEMRKKHHEKILDALGNSKKGLMYEQIAAQIRMDKHQVGRRLNELEKKKLIYKTGEKILTSSRRNACVYKVTTNGEKNAQPEKLMPGKTVSDFSKDIKQLSMNI